MSDRKEKYISGILILLTLEIIFFPVLKISTWDVSLLKMLNMIYGKSNDTFAGSIQAALKQYMSSYIYMLLFLIILTIAVGVSAWVIRSSAVYCIELAGQAVIVITAVLLFRMIKEKLDMIGSTVSYFGIGNVVQFNMMPFILWGLLQIAAVVINIYGLMNMGKEEYKKEEYRKEFVPDYIPTPPYVHEDVKTYPVNDISVNHKEQKEFSGAIEGLQIPYTGKVFPMDKEKYVYILKENNNIILKNNQGKEKCLAKIYYDTKYDEYVVIPQKKCCVHLESGQPLGAGRIYYLPRAMKIVIKNEQGLNENMFRLA